MLGFSRSDTPAPEKKARIVDGAGAKAWLAAMSQPASVQNLAEITQVLHALGALGIGDGSPSLPPERKFAIAERIRGVLLPILNERNSEDRFAVLPIDDDFALHCWTAIDAAIALRDVYAWLVSQLSAVPVLAEPTVTGNTAGSALPAPVPIRPTFISAVGALHRALDVNAQLLLCIQRGRWPVPGRIWERHCVLGQLVRDLDCQDVEVADALRASTTKTCRAAFVMPVMIALADPSSRGAIEFEVMRMAAQRWSAKVGFRLERRADAPAASNTSPARPIANPGPTVHLAQFVLRFDTQSALQSIDKRLDALADGRTPREVGIGDSLRPQVARELLLSLKQRWGAVSPGNIDSPDRAWRPVAVGVQVTAVVGMPTRETMRQDHDRATAAGHCSGANVYAYQRAKPGGITRPREEIERDRIGQLLAAAETWTLSAESADAVRCIRKYSRPRIGLQRLIGLKLGTPDHEAPFLVGWVEALQAGAAEGDELQSGRGGAHTVRVRLAPGLPQMLHASIDDVEVECAFLLVPGVAGALPGRASRMPAFVTMLSDSGANAEPIATRDMDGWDAVRVSPRDYGLILPNATFRPNRLVKAGRRGVVAMLRLEELMMRGADFDLVRFSLL